MAVQPPGHLRAMPAPLRDGALTRSKSELAESMKAFAKRVVDAKTQVEAVVTSTPSLITHETNSAAPGLIQQIDQMLMPTAVAPSKGQ